MENFNFVSKQIYQEIVAAPKILLVAHEKPDGDTLGATSALAVFLDSLGKDYQIFCADPAPAFFYFLPNINKFFNQAERLKQINFNLIITIDCADLKRTRLAEIFADREKELKIINIDHHQSNPSFGYLNLVLDSYSSTSEIIFQLLREWKINFNKEIATALLNGIFTDTGAFTTPSTNLNSLATASALLNFGGRLQEVSKNNFQNKTINALRLWGRALSRLTINKRYQLAYTIIFEKDLEELAATDDDLEGLANFFNNLNDARVSLVIREEGENLRCSLRTTNNLDLSRLAKIFGGGGHAKASGFSISGKLVYIEGRWTVK